MATEPNNNNLTPADTEKLRVLIEVVHPADVLFFANPIRLLRSSGHEIVIASRDKDVTTTLLSELGFQHDCLSTARNGVIGLAMELMQRDAALFLLARKVRPHVMCGFGGVAISHIGRLLSIPAISFYDTDHAKLQQRMTLPFITHQYVPQAYSGPTNKNRTTRFRGDKSMSYLHPSQFFPDHERALSSGLEPKLPNILIRRVSWQANHDIGRQGWSDGFTINLILELSNRGKVHISSEAPLPKDLQHLKFSGSAVDFHHFLAFCDLYIGESATVATEAFLLGVPAIYAVDDPRSYIEDLASKNLLKNAAGAPLNELLCLVDECLAEPKSEVQARRDEWLSTQVDVAGFVAARILDHARQVGV